MEASVLTPPLRPLPRTTVIEEWFGGFHHGSTTQIVGPIGSGKSTVLRTIVRGLAERGERVFCYGDDLRPDPAWSHNVRWWAALPTEADFKGPVGLKENDVVVIDDASLAETPPRKNGDETVASGARWMLKMATYVVEERRASLVVATRLRERVTKEATVMPLGRGLTYRSDYIIELAPFCRTTSGIVSVARLLKNRHEPVRPARFWIRPKHATPVVRT